jgi:glutamyl-tRNA reductase
MRFLTVGCSYRTAPVALRERLAFSETDLPAALARLRALQDVQEGMIVSTCNRVEVYAVVARVRHAARTIRDFLSERREVSADELGPALYEHVDNAALAHIFRVSASLDAMVVGEAQVVGQVKEAYGAAAREHTVGPLLNRCMHRAFATAKRVRNETAIAQHPVSVSSVAAELAARVFGDLGNSTIMVIGAGEMAELAVRHLLSDGASAASIRVVNRTHERAVELAFQLGAKAGHFEDLVGQLLLADIVISSTGSAEPILTRELIAKVMRQRKQRPIFIVDIAVPVDVEAAVGSLPNVYLFNIDDLEQVVQENLKARRKEAVAAERILQVEVEHFEDWLRKQDAVPVIKQLRGQFSTVARAEAARTAQALHLNSGKQRELLDAMADSIVNKLLHHPTVELKDHAASPDGTFLTRAARRLFKLPAGAAEDEVGGESGKEGAQERE